MNNLKIGDVVRCTGLVEFRYNEQNEKLPEVTPTIKVQDFIYIGNKIRYSGTYYKGGHYFGLDGDEYEPPAWTGKKRYKVYQLRLHEDSKIFEALPENVVLLSNKKS